MTIDLMFENKEAREIQYNARASVDDFDEHMAEYATLAQLSKEKVAGIYDLKYGMGVAERLDIFPAIKQPAPLFVFIHGGYWRALRKEEACSMASAFVSNGVAVSCIEYTLAPEATLAEIVREVRSAVAWLYHHGEQYGIDPNRIFIGGSSAGGHLTGMLVADNWQSKFNVPINVIKGALILSGLFDLKPLCDIHVNEWLQLTTEQFHQLSPLFLLPDTKIAPQILLDVGINETLAFKNQTNAYYHACLEKGIKVKLLHDQTSNHFNIVNKLADTQSTIFQEVMKMIYQP